jgi:adenine-specific DNA-methyltransferase
MSKVKVLNQYMTPRWAAELLFNVHFSDARPAHDVVVDPAAGRGSWLHAVPPNVAAFGVEIDPVLAQQAAEDTGRQIIFGDFTTIELPHEPTIVCGNPPFGSISRDFIRKTHDVLPAGGRAGLILPVHTVSFARSTLDLLRGFDVAVELVPRDLYPRISVPLCFLRLTKGRVHRLVGFALYGEAASVRAMRQQYREILTSGRRPLWREVVEMALRAVGGEGTIDDLCAVIQPEFRPTDRPWFRDYLRRDLGLFHDRVRPGYFRLRAVPSGA